MSDTTRQPDQQRLKRPVLHLARCVLEATTPLSVSTGNPDGVFDTALVTDANDLPALPGSSLAGVLRHLWRDSYGNEIHDDTLFGYQRKAQGDASRFSVSWGTLLDSEGHAAEGLLAVSAPDRLTDALYSHARALLDEPVFRNRVRISHRGAAANTGKFDRAVLPRGHRFAVELRLWTTDKDDPDWPRLLNLLAHPALRIGGATRAGLGKLSWIACHQRAFDLSHANDIAAFRALSPALHATQGLTSYTPEPTASGFLTAALKLTPRGFWRIGQRASDFRENVPKPADLVPVTETVIERDGQGKPRIVPDAQRLLFPASSLKGALAHRLNFHVCRFLPEPIWADGGLPNQDRHETVDALLGAIKGKDGGHAGALFLDDAFLPMPSSRLKEVPHNSIDRFTGGVRNRVLYSELSIHGSDKPIEITLTLDLNRLKANAANLPTLQRALKATLDDLREGRLGLGSRTTTGNGFFMGELEGDLADWLTATGDTNNNEEAA